MGAAAGYAIYAYQKGVNGQGITAAVIDTGIVQNSAEFSGRIHGASADVAASRGTSDQDGHGTSVASVLAAAKDDSGMHGVAFNSTLLILRADEEGTCGTAGDCSFSDDVIARAIDIAVENKVRVINISLGGSEPNNEALRQAIGRAAAAGVVIVLPAGNDGAANPDTSAMIATESIAQGTVIIAGAANQAGVSLASFSNRAGDAANHYLVATGENLRAYDKNGDLVLVSGTSFSAPVIAGAVALLAQAFPNLTGREIVEILFTTATDTGEAGADAIFGRGVLNLTGAFAPQGATSMAGSKAPVSLKNNGTLSTAMGDATGELGGAVFLDGYSRAYTFDLAATLAPARPGQPLAEALDGGYRTLAAGTGPVAATVTVKLDQAGDPEVRLVRTDYSIEDGRRARAVAAVALSRLTPRTAVAFGFSESGRSLQQRLAGIGGDGFLAARDPLSPGGFAADVSSSAAIRHDFGIAGLTVTAEQGDIRAANIRQTSERPGYSLRSITADRRVHRAHVRLGISHLEEDGTVLGGRFSPVLSSHGSTSYFVDGVGSFDLGNGWGAAASYRRGWSSVSATGGLISGGRLDTEAFAFDLSKTGAFGRTDQLAFRVAQPLRVGSGGFGVSLPVSYDYGSGDVGYEGRFLSLAPKGREMDYEIAYRIGVRRGELSANAFLRTDPGHVETRSNDAGAAIRFTMGW